MSFAELELDPNIVREWKKEITSLMKREHSKEELEKAKKDLQNDTFKFFVTESFGSFLIEAKNDEDKIAAMLSLLSRIYEWCKGKPKVKLVKFIHGQVIDFQNDLLMTEDDGVKISCKAGCSFCCYQQVLMTTGESILIKQYLEKNKDTFVAWDRMKLHKEWERNDKGSAWNHPVHKNKRCPFLGDNNLCSIYPVRPFACRVHLSIDDPSMCDLEGERKDVRYVNTFPVALFLNAYAAIDDLRPIAHYW